MDFNGYLMSGDRKVARIEKGRLSPLDKAHMPLYLVSYDDLEGWLEGRAIDRHRPNSRILKKVLRLTDSSDLAAVLRAHGATITDNYWVLRSEESLTYDQVRFSEDSFAEVALTGSFSSFSKQYSDRELSSGSPELTNIGSYEKCWRLIDGSWWLYKSGNVLERYSEVFISRLGKLLGFSVAEYQPENGFVKTRDFTEGKYNFEPAEAIVGEEEDYSFNYDRLTALASILGEEYLDILFMDALCFNVDRHTKNYGVLRDRATGEIVGMAPNFDNNIALISRGYGEDPAKTSGLLLTDFLELIRAKELIYTAPALTKEALVKLADSVLPEEDIRRDYVVEMVWERWQRLSHALEPSR